MADLFDFKLIDSFPGYNSAGDKTTLKPGVLIRGSKNVYKKVSGTYASRPGIKRRGTQDSTNSGVNASYEWETSTGITFPLRVSNGKLQIESDIADAGTLVWYDLLESSTLAQLAETYTRFVFNTWWDNDEKSDRLVMVCGGSYVLHWSGGIALIASATAATITKQGSETWAELGFAINLSGEKKIIIDDREFTYTGGEDTDTLTGVTASSGDASTLTSGMIAIQSVFKAEGGSGNLFPATYNADFALTFGNQFHVGSYKSRVIYQSADVTAGAVLGFLNFSNTGAHVAGDPDKITLDTLGKGIGEKDGYVAIFAGQNELYLVSPNTNVTYTYTDTDGGARFVYNKIEKKILPGLTSALGHEFIGNFNDYLLWLDQKNRLRALGSFTNDTFIKPVSLSISVQDELTEDNFTGGHLKVIDDTVYLTAPATGRDWMYTIRDTVNNDGSVTSDKFWHPPQIRGISRFATIDGVVYGHSNVNPQIFQIWDTGQWFDDGFTDGDGDIEEIPYTWVMRFAYQSHGRPEGRITFDMVYWEGYMLQGTDVQANIYLDYQGATAIRPVVISSNTNLAHFYTGIIPSSLGDASLGDNPLGDGIIEEANDQSTVPKFRDITDVPIYKNCFEYSLEIYSTKVDGRFELLRAGPNIRLASESPIFLRKPSES